MYIYQLFVSCILFDLFPWIGSFFLVFAVVAKRLRELEWEGKLMVAGKTR